MIVWIEYRVKAEPTPDQDNLIEEIAHQQGAQVIFHTTCYRQARIDIDPTRLDALRAAAAAHKFTIIL